MRVRVLGLLLCLSVSLPLAAQQWFTVSTEHLVAYADSDRGARDAAYRSEQLVSLFGQVFHRKSVGFATPLRIVLTHSPEALSGSHEASAVDTRFATFVVADSRADAWNAAAEQVARTILKQNYPRTQPWFDSGVAAYLGAMRTTPDGRVELGAPPPSLPPLTAQNWIPLPRLFAVATPESLSAEERRLFLAESWAVVRWLIDQQRLSDAGKYFDQVQNRGAQPDRAILTAFGLGAADLDREVQSSARNTSPQAFPAPANLEAAMLIPRKLSPVEGHVLTASIGLGTAQRDKALEELVQIMRANQNNVEAHRALAWAYQSRHMLDDALEHLRRAIELNDSDPGMHYLYAVCLNNGEESDVTVESAVVRISGELNRAIHMNPNYAPPYELLGLAQLHDEQYTKALASLKQASALSPRNDRYYLNLAHAYDLSGDTTSAKNLLLYVQGSDDPNAQRGAREMMASLGKRQKQQQHWAEMGIYDPKAASREEKATASAERSEEEAPKKEPEAAPDTRKTEYLKGRIVSVDCSSGPGASITVNAAGRTWTMQVADRKELVLIGPDRFDCSWKGVTASINYKSAGKQKGDVVSLEID